MVILELKDTYKTLKSPATGLFKDKGSKFLAFAYPIVTEDEIKSILTEVKKEYFDARHHCYAYVLGSNKEIFRSSDDGEPSGTAGKPILGQLYSFDVSNVLIIVVRYFGGTLLGTGGLIQAYKNASADALKNAQIIEKTIDEIFKLSFNYLAMNNVMKILKEEAIEQWDHRFDNDCSITIAVRAAKSTSLKDQLLKISSLKMEFLHHR